MNKDQELVTLRHRIVDNETKLKNLSDTESLNNENNRDIKRSLSEKEKIIKRFLKIFILLLLLLLLLIYLVGSLKRLIMSELNA